MRRYRIPIVVKPHEAGLRHRRGHRMEPIKTSGIAHQLGSLRLEHLPDRPLTHLRVGVSTGIGDASLQQPDIQLLVVLDPKPRREEPLPHQANLVPNLPLLPTRCRCAGHGIDQIVAAHLLEAPVVGALAANEDRLHRGLHVVVDPARAGALEEGKRPVMGVEHHLLRLARIRPHEQHPAVAQPDMRHFHRHRRAVDQHDLVAPVELVSLAGRKAQRHIGSRRCRGAIALPPERIPPNRIVAARITTPSQILENPEQRQPFAARLRLIARQQRIEIILPRSNPRQRLVPASVAEFRLRRTHNLPHDLPRNPQVPADLLDLLALRKIRPPNSRNRLHHQHPNPGPHPREPS